jgi:sigma-B regulation protein RsbU (phosphoserine phosphatase)
MHGSIRRAIAALTLGRDAERHFDLAADRIQRALLEVAIPSLDHLDIGVHAEPARLVGGDYVDLYISGGVLAFGLGDASGKSLAAALNALMLRYLVRGLLISMGTQELATVVKHTNAVVADDMQDDQFITFILGAIDPGTGVMRIVNAGHEPPLILRAGATAVETTTARGIVLGVESSTFYEQEELLLGRGDIFVVYTDGLTEATNERGELYTIERLRDFLVEHRTESAAELAESIFQAVKAYSGGELRDDATVLVLRMT